MNPEILKLTMVVLLLLFTGASCQKDEIEYADESIEISSYPGITIYKTKKDYINYVDVQITDDGRLNAIPSYNKNDPRISFDSKGNAKQNFRWRLKSGYILDNNASLREAFTNITIHEYVDWNTSHGVSSWPNSSIEPRIIDKDPFTEFYFHDGINKTPRTFTLGEINDMIKNGTLETVFTKLK
jgi:hypothetical protein